MSVFLISNVSVLSVTALVSLSLVATPASAFGESGPSDDVLTSSEITSSLDNAGALVQPALPSVSSSQDAAVAYSGNVTVEVPKDLNTGVDLTGTGLDLTIRLPNAVDAGIGVKNSDGQVVYSSTSASANTVIPVEGGVQMLTTIANSTAPENYTYQVEATAGYYFQIQDDGSVFLLSSDGSSKLGVLPAWATDANGQSIPTHYETDGTSLTQIIEHNSVENIAYPVTADPQFALYLGFYPSFQYNRAETYILISQPGYFCIWFTPISAAQCLLNLGSISYNSRLNYQAGGCSWLVSAPGVTFTYRYFGGYCR